jgi:hypothetical protein
MRHSYQEGQKMDIIANDPGGGRTRGPINLRLPRWARAMAAGTAVVTLLGYVVTHRVAGLDDLSPSWQSLTPAADLSQRAASGTLTGRPGYGPSGLRVLLGGTDPRIVDLHTGGEHPLAEVPRPPGSSVYLTAIRGTLLANVVGPKLAASYVLQPGQPTRRLNTAGYAVLGQHSTPVITFEFRPSEHSQLITGRRPDGRQLWQWRVPALLLPIRDTGSGLLLQRPVDGPDGPAGLLLVRRENGQLLRRFTDVAVAVGDDSIVFADPGCRPRCTLVRTRLDTGVTTRFALPGGVPPDSGVISPGGRWLALEFPAGGGTSGATVGVLDLHTGVVWPVPGMWTAGPHQAGLVWSADGKSLVVAVGIDAMQIGVWRPDQPLDPVTVLPKTFPGLARWVATLP